MNSILRMGQIVLFRPFSHDYDYALLDVCIENKIKKIRIVHTTTKNKTYVSA